MSDSRNIEEKLKRIKTLHSGMPTENIKKIINDPSKRELDLSHCKLNNSSLAVTIHLAEILSLLPHVTTVNLSSNHIHTWDLAMKNLWIDALKNAPHIIQLEMHWQDVCLPTEKNNGQSLVERLPEAPGIHALKMNGKPNPQWRKDEINLFMQDLQKANTIHTLTLDHCDMSEWGSEKIKAFAEGLKSGSSITTLNMVDCKMGQWKKADWEVFLHCLQSSGINEVNFENNELNNEQQKMIQQYLIDKPRTTIMSELTNRPTTMLARAKARFFPDKVKENIPKDVIESIVIPYHTPKIKM